MPGADDCAIAFRQGMLDVLKLDVLKLDTLPPEWEPMGKGAGCAGYCRRS